MGRRPARQVWRAEESETPIGIPFRLAEWSSGRLLFYHRCYDFVSLAFPLVCCLLAKPSAFTALCWLVVLNTFFFLRLDFALGLGVYVPVNFALHLAALAALTALTCYRSRKAPEV